MDNSLHLIYILFTKQTYYYYFEFCKLSSPYSFTTIEKVSDAFNRSFFAPDLRQTLYSPNILFSALNPSTKQAMRL